MTKLEHKTFGSVGVSSFKKVEEVKEIETPENALRSLIELGCVKEEKVLFGKLFKMKSLSASERLSLTKILGNEPNHETVFSFNINILAYSIESVDNKPLESYHPDYVKNSNIIELRCQIIEAFQPALINSLLDLYNDITAKSDKQYSIDEIKK